MGSEGVAELQSVLEFANAAGIARQIRVDPSLARGLSYYTGAIMEISVKDLAGSLGGGGRYDNLVGMFAGQDIPACGFSLGLERILVVMGEREMFPPNMSGAAGDVMVAIWNDESIGESIQLAQELRGQGLRVDLYPEADKLGKQFKYASIRGLPFVAVIGDEERARGEVAIKDLRTGVQRTVERKAVGSTLKIGKIFE
jgi:histidyl-tRNA synthetase